MTEDQRTKLFGFIKSNYFNNTIGEGIITQELNFEDGEQSEDAVEVDIQTFEQKYGPDGDQKQIFLELIGEELETMEKDQDAKTLIEYANEVAGFFRKRLKKVHSIEDAQKIRREYKEFNHDGFTQETYARLFGKENFDERILGEDYMLNQVGVKMTIKEGNLIQHAGSRQADTAIEIPDMESIYGEGKRKAYLVIQKVGVSLEKLIELVPEVRDRINFGNLARDFIKQKIDECGSQKEIQKLMDKLREFAKNMSEDELARLFGTREGREPAGERRK